MSRIPGSRALCVCSALIFMAGAGWAQSKVAVISLQRAVIESEEIQKASAAMEAKYKPRQQELEKAQKDLQGIQQQLQAGQGKLTSQAEADLTSQGQRRQRDIQRMSEDLQADVDRERNEVLGTSTRKDAGGGQEAGGREGLRRSGGHDEHHLFQTSAGHHRRGADGVQQGLSGAQIGALRADGRLSRKLRGRR